jgi:phosphatidate cytidylyltransferase
MLLMGIIMIGCLTEFYKISAPMLKKDILKGHMYRNIELIISSAIYVIISMTIFHIIPTQYLFGIPVLISTIFTIELFIHSKRPFRNIGINLISLYYIVMPMSIIHLAAQIGEGYSGAVILGILFLIWANDSGAYIIGSLIGRTKLIPHVSPNKTIEGSIGGGLLTFLVAFLVIYFLPKLEWFKSVSYIKPFVWYMIALGVFIFASTGDLIESLLKRSLNIKDSGSILPGHGGFLDRFDAFLYVAPIIIAIIKIFN